MRIGLIDADGNNFPNLALMKLSYYHKSVGDSVEWVNYWQEYDRVYISKVFTFSADPDIVIRCDDVVRGGTGYDLTGRLDSRIEEGGIDYGLYPNVKFALGFITRGCSRGCPFCIVNEKEGGCHIVDESLSFWKGQKEIKLLDPNLLESPKALLHLERLVNTKAWVDFTQGLDIRLMTKTRTQAMLKIKVKRVHFAYDLMKYADVIERNLSEFMQVTGWKRNRVTVYILTNFNTTLEEDLHRIEFVKRIGATPYVMIYDKHKLPKGSVLNKLQRWCNAPQILFSTEWNDYQKQYMIREMKEGINQNLEAEYQELKEKNK